MLGLNTALSGVISASQRFDASAIKTVKTIAAGGDVVSDFVEQIEARNAFEASVKVVKTTDEMIGRLLDIRA